MGEINENSFVNRFFLSFPKPCNHFSKEKSSKELLSFPKHQDKEKSSQPHDKIGRILYVHDTNVLLALCDKLTLLVTKVMILDCKANLG